MKQTALCSELTRAEMDAEALAKAPVDLSVARTALDLLESLCADFRSLEDDILMSCIAQDFDAYLAESTAILKIYKSAKLKLMKLLDSAEAPAMLPEVNRPQLELSKSTPTAPVPTVAPGRVKLYNLKKEEDASDVPIVSQQCEAQPTQVEETKFQLSSFSPTFAIVAPGSLKLKNARKEDDAVTAFIEETKSSVNIMLSEANFNEKPTPYPYINENVHPTSRFADNYKSEPPGT